MALVCALIFAASPPCAAGDESASRAEVEIAAALCLSGDEAMFGRNALEGIQLAFDEVNARGDGPKILLKTYDDQSNVEAAKRAARQPGQYYRLQRVVQTGTYLNLIPHIDLAKSTFGADFYVWLRCAHDAGPRAADPLDISFPSMVGGHFDPAAAAESTETADGTEYRLWRVQGEFRTDFDLHRFPFDRQELPLRFFNARASSDRIVYVLDRRATTLGGSGQQFTRAPDAALAAPAAASADTKIGDTLISPAAFTELTQWRDRCQ